MHSPINTLVTRRLALATLVVFLAGCTTIASFDQYAYQEATSLKVDALALIDLAADAYPQHDREVAAVITRIDKAYEYDHGREKNEISVQLWDKLRDPDGHLFGGFVRRWRTETKLGATYVKEKKLQIAEAFDNIIQLESGKRKPSDIK